MEKPKKTKRASISAKVWHEGYGYIINRVMNTADERVVKYLKCQDALCRASAKIINGEFIDISAQHNHPKNDIDTKKNHFKENLKLLIQSTNMSVKDAYNNIASKDPRGALHCPMEGLVSSMRRWRKEATRTAPKPENLTALAECLESGSWKHISRNYDGPFYVGQVEVENQIALFFGNAKFISSTFKDSEELFIDINYRMAPKDPFVHQLVTIFAVVNAAYIFPIAYILMEGDSEILYRTALHYFQTKLAPDIKPKFIICPYEDKLNSALRSVYTYSNVHGSFFHYVKAIYSKALALGITNQTNNPEVLGILKRYYTIPLLPYNLIQETFDELRDMRPDIFSPLWDYILVNWIRKVAVVHMCVFGQPHRTHAFWIAYNKRLYEAFEEDRPEMSKLIGELKKIHTLARGECKKLKEDKIIEKMVFRTDALFHPDMKQMWNELTVGNITLAEFKSTVSYFVENEHSVCQDYSVDEDISLADNLPNLKNCLFRPHTVQYNSQRQM